jgi:hypothetical protein
MPDTIAYDYYGQSKYEWLVCIVNNIYDIHSDWLKDTNQFYSYLKSKYESIPYTKITTHHYEYTGIGGNNSIDIARRNWKMTPKTYDTLDEIEKSGWTAVTIHEEEFRLNEAKRNIKLISNEYLKQIDRELRDLF